MATKLEVEKALYKANLFKMNNIFNSESELVQNVQAFQKYAVEKYVAFHINNGASDAVIEKLLNLGFSTNNFNHLQIFNDAVAKISSLDKVDVGVYSNMIGKYNLGFSREHMLKEFNAIQTKHFADSVEVRSEILGKLKFGIEFSKVIREVKSNMTLAYDCCDATSVGVDISSGSDNDRNDVDELSFVKARISSFGYDLDEVEGYLDKRAFVGFVVMRMKEIADKFGDAIDNISDTYYNDNIDCDESEEVTLDDWYKFLAISEVYGTLDLNRYNLAELLIDSGEFVSAYNEFINVQRVSYSLCLAKVQSNLHDIITDQHNINWD